jgi:hypothetical protein
MHDNKNLMRRKEGKERKGVEEEKRKTRIGEV